MTFMFATPCVLAVLMLASNIEATPGIKKSFDWNIEPDIPTSIHPSDQTRLNEEAIQNTIVFTGRDHNANGR